MAGFGKNKGMLMGAWEKTNGGCEEERNQGLKNRVKVNNS